MNTQQVNAAEGFAVWLANAHPALFEALANRAARSAGLSGWSDIVSSIGRGITTAVKSVGSYLVSTEGVKTLSALAGTYLTTKAQKDILNVQLQRAEQGQEPAPISYATNAATGAMTPVYTTGGMTTALDYSVLASFAPRPWYERYAVPLVVGGAALLFLLLRSRS